MRQQTITILTLCLLAAVLQVDAQSVNHVWTKSIGSTGSDEGSKMLVDAAGNVYVAGKFSGTTDFDPGPGVTNLTSSGFRDVFISKWDASGNLLWVRNLQGTGDDQVYGFAVDASGSVYTSGVYDGTLDLDPGVGVVSSTAGFFDAYISKLDASGNFVWGKFYSGFGISAVNTLAVDAAGNLIIAGVFAGGPYDFDPGPGTFNLTATMFDAFFTKLDASGNFLWAKNFGSGQSNEAKSVTTDAAGNIYLSGIFDGTVDIDPGAAVNNITSAGDNDIFVSKFDGSGNFMWAKTMGGTAGDYVHTTVLDQSGNILTAGTYNGTADFDPGSSVVNLTPGGQSDIYVSKLDPSGNFIWAKGMGGPGNEQSYGIVTDNTGNVYTAGEFTGAADFDPGTNIFNLYTTALNGFTTKLSPAGDFLWARNVARGNSFTRAQAFALNSTGDLYVTGSFSDTADFDPGANVFPLTSASAGSSDFFLQKLSQSNCSSPSYTHQNMTVCDSLNIAGNSYHSTGFYSNVFSNVSGCDSVLNIDLIVNYSSDTNYQLTVCDSLFFNGQFETVSGTYLDTFSNLIGCDSFVTLQLTVLQSSFDTLVQTACDTFNLNGVDYTLTGFYSQSYSAANGCDSVIVLDLTILNSIDTIIQGACDSFDFNGTVYTTTGFYTQSYTSSLGCDSILVLELTIGSVNTSVSISGSTLTSGMTGANYQWVDCGNNYATIPGETNQSFTPLQSGQYAVIISSSGCTDTSICTSVTVGIDDVAFKDGLSVYPNPTDGIVHVVCKTQFADAVIRVVNPQGQTVRRFNNINGRDHYIDLHELPSGVYFLEVVESNKRRVFKVSKN